MKFKRSREPEVEEVEAQEPEAEEARSDEFPPKNPPTSPDAIVQMIPSDPATTSLSMEGNRYLVSGGLVSVPEKHVRRLQTLGYKVAKK